MASARGIRSPSVGLVVAFVTGFVLHVLMDGIPHSDYHRLSRPWVVITVGVETALIGMFAAWRLGPRWIAQWRGPIVAGLAGSVLPDVKFVALLILPAQYARTIEMYGDRLHAHFHAAPVAVVTGMTTQLVCAIALLVILAVMRPGNAQPEPRQYQSRRPSGDDLR